MSQDSTPLQGLREPLEQAIRDTIAGIKQNSERVVHQLPAESSPESALHLSTIPELQRIRIAQGTGDERTLQVEVYFSHNPNSEEDISSDEATFLSDTGSRFAELSDAIMTALLRYCDAPRHDQTQVLTTERADLSYDPVESSADLAVYTTSIWYPEYIERIYTEGRADVANHLRLPY